jgi:formate dehydrogenase subunit delta
MANQIAAFFAAQGELRAVPGIADHLVKFWEPAMRGRLLELAEMPDVALNDLVRDALPLVAGSLAQ